MRIVSAFIEGVPAPQGSKSAYVRGGRAVIVEGSSKTGREKHKAWRHAVTTQLLHTRLLSDDEFPLTGPVGVSIEFLLPRPKTAKDTVSWAPKKPDLDKLVRATFDSVTDANIWLDDAQVVFLRVEKLYADDQTGARLVIHGME
jgi:crossover junction endodeoxyribonuclease RusA